MRKALSTPLGSCDALSAKEILEDCDFKGMVAKGRTGVKVLAGIRPQCTVKKRRMRQKSRTALVPGWATPGIQTIPRLLSEKGRVGNGSRRFDKRPIFCYERMKRGGS